jgi:probable O-glycosylation ligase (exosortase A-associated)
MTPLPVESMSLTAVVFWALYASGIAGALMNPVVGVLLYILVYHVNPESQWWGASFQGMRTSFIVALATILGILLKQPRFDRVGRQITTPIGLAIALFLLASMSVTWGYGFSQRGAYQIEKFFKVIIFVLILVRCVRHASDYHLVILAWISGVAYLGYQSWGSIGHVAGGRLTGGLGGPDFAESSGLSVHLVATLPLIGIVVFQMRRWWWKLAFAFVGALTVNTIILTRTRNAIVGLAAMGFLAAWWLPKGYRWRGIIAMVIGSIVALHLTDNGWWERMQTITEFSEDSSAANRIAFWSASLQMVADHPLGIGVGNFHHVIQEYLPELQITRSAHNTYITCLAELGVLGLLIHLVVIFTSLNRLAKVQQLATRENVDLTIPVGAWHSRFHLAWHAMGLRCAIVGYCACGFFTTRLWTEGFWLLIGMATALSNVAEYVLVDRLAMNRDTAEADGSAPPANQPLPDRVLPQPGPAFTRSTAPAS